MSHQNDLSGLLVGAVGLRDQTASLSLSREYVLKVRVCTDASYNHVYFQKALPAMVTRPSVLPAVNTLANLSNSKRGSSENVIIPRSKRSEVVPRKGLEKQNPLR